jgi:purine-binding chemotaxis protein CheW
MSAVELHISGRAANLRRNFDRSFVEAQHFEPVATEDFLSIRLAGDSYVLRLAEIGGLFVDKKVTALPSSVAELKGVAGFRGVIVPVYDLAALLGYPPSGAARWMVMVAAARVALAFDAFDGHFRFAGGAVASHANSNSREHVRQIVRSKDRVHAVIHLPSIIAAIRNRVRAATPNKEQ